MNKTELKQVLKKAIRGVKDGLHVGANLLLVQVKSGTLMISARNPIWSICARADIADGEKEFSCVVNSTIFNQIVDKMPGEDISLSVSKTKQVLQIKSGKLKASIPYMQDYKWPEPSPFKPLHSFEIEEKCLNCSHALEKKDAMNGLLSSYHIELLTDGLRVTALDTRRISICTFGQGKPQYDIVAAGEIIKEAIGLSGGKTYLETDGQSMLLTGEGIEIFAKTRPEPYPNISNILSNRESRTSMSVNRQEFLDAILVATLLDDVVILNVSEKGTTLSNKPSIKGNSSIELTTNVKGPDIRIGIDGTYLKDSLRAMSSEEVTFHFNNPKTPVYTEEANQLELIMPVSIQTSYSSREHTFASREREM
nr:hypothetical protein [uncultured Blautia sp.]